MHNIQKNVFLNSEADEWYSRNEISGEKLTKKRNTDLVFRTLKHMKHPPKRVLEIGASNGWRLHLLQELWPNSSFMGLEPSTQAALTAYEGIDIKRGTAEKLPFEDAAFDMVIFGFCLYLCDRKDLFRIATEADRVLENDGLMITYDFHTEIPYRNPYAHLDHVYSYKMDYSLLFSWSPAYRVIETSIETFYEGDVDIPDNHVGISIFRKNISEGWPDRPKEE